jgi:hypothetical protein
MLENHRAAAPALRSGRPHGHRYGQIANFQGHCSLILQIYRPQNVLIANGIIDFQAEERSLVVGDEINGFGKSAFGIGDESSRAIGG